MELNKQYHRKVLLSSFHLHVCLVFIISFDSELSFIHVFVNALLFCTSAIDIQIANCVCFNPRKWF